MTQKGSSVLRKTCTRSSGWRGLGSRSSELLVVPTCATWVMNCLAAGRENVECSLLECECHVSGELHRAVARRVTTMCARGLQLAWDHGAAVMRITTGVLKKQRTCASTIAGSKQGESATAIMMVHDDKWYDPKNQATVPIVKQFAAEQMGEEVANSFATQPLECCCGDGARGETDHLEACQRAFSAHAMTDRAVQRRMKPVFVSRLQPARKSVACVTPPSWWRKLCVLKIQLSQWRRVATHCQAPMPEQGCLAPTPQAPHLG